MKLPTNFTAGMLALSMALGLVQWSRIQHDREVAARRQPSVTPANGSSYSSRLDPLATALRTLLTSGDPAPIDTQEEKEHLLALSRQLPPDRLRDVLLALNGDPASDEEVKSEILIDYSDTRLHEALLLALDLPERVEATSNFGALGFLFRRWASAEPAAALAWLRSEEARIPAGLRDGMVLDACVQLVAVDPESALANILAEARLLNEVTGSELGEHLTNPQDLRTFFKAMDEMAPDPEKAAAVALLRDGVAVGVSELLSHQSDEESLALIDECLNARDKVIFAAACDQRHLIHKPAQWADWLVKLEQPTTLDAGAEAAPAAIVSRMRSWVTENYRTAGAWLLTMPEGQLKQDTIAAYAERVRVLEPALAAQWAMRLATSEQRDEILGRIAVNLEKKDPAAAQSLRQCLTSIP